MTVANPVSAFSQNAQNSPGAQSRRSRLAAAANPVLAGPSTSAVAVGETSAGDVACVTLANAQLRLDVAPTLGGGITRFDWRDDGALTPIFRRCRHVAADTQPNELACYPLLPYSNRIGGGHFNVAGRRVDVARNCADEPFPIHGDGWQSAWQVADSDREYVRLTLDRRDGKPYAFRAAQTYKLDGPSLVITLEIENAGREAL
ncbi:MAG: aldose 1-epimerase, partial [Paraburkholderia graminis]